MFFFCQIFINYPEKIMNGESLRCYYKFSFNDPNGNFAKIKTSYKNSL